MRFSAIAAQPPVPWRSGYCVGTRVVMNLLRTLPYSRVQDRYYPSLTRSLKELSTATSTARTTSTRGRSSRRNNTPERQSYLSCDGGKRTFRTFRNGHGKRSQCAAALSTGTNVSGEKKSPENFPLIQFSRTSGFSLGALNPQGKLNPPDACYVTVVPDVITSEQERELVRDLETVFARKRYQKGHWDSVIEDYKESERLDGGGGWNPESQQIVDDIRTTWLQAQVEKDNGGKPAPWLPVHAIDLSPKGFIRPHVDSVKFSGGLVAGLSLMSAAVMQLTKASDNDMADLLLPPRSLYILRGPARFEWAHAILPHDGAPIKWHGRTFTRGRRVSLIFRDELIGPAPEPHSNTVTGENKAY